MRAPPITGLIPSSQRINLAALTVTRVPSPLGTLVCSLESPASSLNGFKTEKPERGLPETETLPTGNPTAAESNPTINSFIGTAPIDSGLLFDCHYGFVEGFGQGITLAGRLRGSPNCCKISSSANTVTSLRSSVNFGGSMQPTPRLGSPLMAVQSLCH